MEELIKRLERVIQTGAPDKDGLHPIAAEVVLEVVKELTEHGTNLAEVGTDTISRRAAIDAVNCVMVMKGIRSEKSIVAEAVESAKRIMTDNIRQLSPIQPEIVKCKDCKHHWTHKCMDSMPIERCDLEQTFYDAEVDYCSLAERRDVTA